MQIAVSDAKAQLTDLMRRAEAGEEVLLTRHGQPRVRLVPVEQEIDRDAIRRRRLIGIDRAIAAAKRRGPDGGASAARSQDYLYGEGWPAGVIAIDTSALMAIILNEPSARKCRAAVERADDLLIAAPNLTEALVVADGRQIGGEMGQLIADLNMTVVPFSETLAYAAARAYRRWGKGYHRAKLNLADSFAYALATEHDVPLLYVGNDFAKTDVISALA